MQPHRLDPLSLIAGLVFVTIGVGSLLSGPTATGWLTALRFWPVLLVAAGIVVLVRMARRTDDT